MQLSTTFVGEESTSILDKAVPDVFDEERLTSDEEKRSLYAWDPYFRDCVDDLSNFTVAQKSKLLFEYVPLILRPDALLTGQFRDVIRIIEAAGFEAVSVERFVFDRCRIRECWKYQMNTATRERLDVFDMMLTGHPAAYILWRKPSVQGRSAAEQLNDLKGSSDPTKRKPGDLRFATDKVQLSVFTYIHIPDEPIDFLRELGAFFDRKERLAIVHRALRSVPMEAMPAVEKFAAQIGHHPLTTDAAWSSLMSAATDGPKRQRLEGLYREWQSDSRKWRQICQRLVEELPGVSHWDLVAISAASALTHDPSRAPVIAPKYVHTS